jgi:hypothetical protein
MTHKADGRVGGLAWRPAGKDERQSPTKAKNENIRVSPAVLDAAGKDGEALLRSLRTASDTRLRVEQPW